MSSPKPPLPSLAGLWGLLWRGIVYLPLALLITIGMVTFPVALLGTGLWMIAFTMMAQWWHAIACAIALTTALFIDPRVYRRFLSHGSGKEQQSSPGEYFL